MKRSVFFPLFLLVVFVAQAQVNLDSLKGIWEDETAPDSSRAQAMHDIIRAGYLYSNPDSAFYFAQMMYDFADEKGLKKEMADALGTQGASYYVRGDFSMAMEYYLGSLKIYEEIPDKKGMAKLLNNIGVIYSNRGDYPNALEYCLRSLRIKEEISDRSGMAGAMNNIGLIFMNQGDYPNALEYYQRSLKIKEEVSDRRGIAQILNNIGLIYMKRQEYPQALDCFRQSYAICEELSDQNGMAGILANIGLIYMNQGNYPLALDHFQQSLKIREEISDRKGMAGTFNNIGELYMNQGNYASAREYFQRSIAINEEITDKRGLAISYINMGKISNFQGDHAQAIRWCSQSLLTSEEINILEEQKNACQCLYDAHKAIGNERRALEFLERITMLDDSLQAGETAKMLQKMEFARKMLADSLVREKEKLKVQLAHEAEVRKKERTRNIFIFTALFLLLGAVGLYLRVAYMRDAKKEIEKEKDRSDKLLLNILPSEIAEELKEKGKAEARKFEMVSVLFTDFKEFTQTSEKLSAEELVGEINTCFEAFDAICARRGIEKIKTIGDSYMAAGGLPVPREDSVNKTVLAGLEMVEFTLNRKKERQAEGNICFEMRVGIHTGPVVAGIVGVSKFQYDIWGDTVNTASRMENSGDAGKLNISQSTYELVKDDPAFKFEPRGKVNVKGKGDIEMWFVEKA